MIGNSVEISHESLVITLGVMKKNDRNNISVFPLLHNFEWHVCEVKKVGYQKA